MYQLINFTDVAYPLIAGFSDRSGGYSQGELSGVNLCFSSEDHNFEKNLALISQNLQVNLNHWCWLNQIHSRKIVEVNLPGIQGEADGLYTTKSNLMLAVKTADCVPIIAAHKKIPFVMAVHAGWKGIKAGILNQLLHLIDDNGFRSDNFVIAVGPHLRSCHYEVTAEFLENFPASYFVSRGGKYYFDLSAVVFDQLFKSGFKNIKENFSKICTYCSVNHYSYRQSPITGRQIGFIGILS